MRFSCFRALPGSAEALVRCGGKMQFHLTSYVSWQHTCQQKLSKSVDVHRRYSKWKQCRFHTQCIMHYYTTRSK